MPDGSFYQQVPLHVTSVSQAGTKITVQKAGVETTWHFGKSFGANFTANGSYFGEVVFAGSDLNELLETDLRGKMVVILDDDRFGLDGSEPNPWLTTRLESTLAFFREKGASAVLCVASPEKQARISIPSGFYDYAPTGRLQTLYESQRAPNAAGFAPTTLSSVAQRPPMPFTVAGINHTLAAALMGIDVADVANLFATQRRGEVLASVVYSDSFARLDVAVDIYPESASNVVAMVEGSDPVLKNEYVVVTSHHDGRGIDDGEVIPGADDNMTGVVGMFEVARALLVERPKRSVILAWMCGEEQMMHGSHYFANNCPVPVEKITACINLDMLGRNHTDSLFLVASDMLSTELDQAIHKANNNSGVRFGFDYSYSDVTHPLRVYFRSDHYPFMRFGVPSVWLFCGFTNDYHTYRDVVAFIDFPKFLKATKLTYLTVMEVGNRKEMLKLDVNPAVTVRGAHNLEEVSLYGRP